MIDIVNKIANIANDFDKFGLYKIANKLDAILAATHPSLLKWLEKTNFTASYVDFMKLITFSDFEKDKKSQQFAATLQRIGETLTDGKKKHELVGYLDALGWAGEILKETFLGYTKDIAEKLRVLAKSHTEKHVMPRSVVDDAREAILKIRLV